MAMMLIDYLKNLFQERPETLPFGVLLVLAGVVICFFGSRIMRPALAVVGFVAGSHIFPHSFIVDLINTYAEGTINPAVVIGMHFFFSLLCALLFYNLINIAVYLFAATAGYTLFQITCKVLKTSSLNFEIKEEVRRGLTVFAVLIPVFLVSFIERIVLSAATACIGAALIMAGVDKFANKNFMFFLNELWESKEQGTDFIREKIRGRLGDLDLAAMFGAYIAIAVVGTLYQIHFGERFSISL